MGRERSSEPTREHRLVRVLLRAVQTALRARRLRASVAEADAALQLAFAPVWNWLPGVELTIGSEALRFDGVELLDVAGDEEGFGSSLYAAGVRHLTLTPGAEIEEIQLVLSAIVMARERQGTPGTDLLTSLFRADLDHIHYEADDYVAAVGRASGLPQPLPAPRIGSPEPEAPASPEVIRDTVRRDAAGAGPDRGVVRLEHFDSTLYFLDEQEIAYLKSAIDREYAQDLAVNALALLLDVLELRVEPDARQEVILILSDFLPELLTGGRFESVAYLVAGVRDAAQSAASLSASQKEALDQLRASISDPRAIAQLFHALEGGAVAPTPESMGTLLRELRPSAIRQVLGWSEQLTNRQTRSAVVEALDAFFTEWPHSLSRMLNAPEREVVQAGLALAARLRLPAFGEIVGEAAGHEDPMLRRSVAETLAAIGTSASLRRLADMAEDADRDVRVVVYRGLSMRPSRTALSGLQGAIAGRNLESRGQREKRALFEAFGAVAGPEGLATLVPLLHGRNPHGPRPSSHTRACAALALGVIGTPAARAELQKAAKDRDPLVRRAVGSALRGEV